MLITPVILCGGSGSRLWPLSRANYPKQFVKVVDDHTLFETTLLRITEAEGFGAPLIICNEKHQYLCQEQLQALNIDPLGIIIEPVGRNTTAAITVACSYVRQQLGNDATVLVLPIDHVFGDHQRYFDLIREVSAWSAQHLITFGVKPVYAHTGYGYIRRGTELATGLFQVAQFIEKPNEQAAEQLIADGDCYWNSGTFLLNVSRFIDEVIKFHPAIYDHCQSALASAKRQQQFLKLGVEAFIACEDISVDYAIFEKSNRVAVAELDVAFTDIGSWESVYEHGHKDDHGNVSRGKVYTEDTRNCLLHSEQALLVATGLEDCVVVAARDGIFISKQGHSQEIKRLLPTLKQRYPEQFNNQIHVRRPWGSYQVLLVETGYKVKQLCVNPGAQLSLQLHRYRSEHWVVVSGTATIVVGEQERELAKAESVFIPANTKHRIANHQDHPLVIVETQMGERVDETDIIRFEDVYERELV